LGGEFDGGGRGFGGRRVFALGVGIPEGGTGEDGSAGDVAEGDGDLIPEQPLRDGYGRAGEV